jgi:hypothetical protein
MADMFDPMQRVHRQTRTSIGQHFPTIDSSRRTVSLTACRHCHPGLSHMFALQDDWNHHAQYVYLRFPRRVDRFDGRGTSRPRCHP